MPNVYNWQIGREMSYPHEERHPQWQFAFVFNPNRCIGCQTCTMACKSTWTFSKGQELMWWNNVETKPYGGYPQHWDAKLLGMLEEANPGVTIQIQAIQNEDMDGKLQTALNSGDAPDIFMARGGGKLADVVEAGQAMDITDAISEETRAAVGDAAFSAFSVDGAVYGMPVAVLPGGIYYSEDLFGQAGVTAPPETIEDLEGVVDQLKTAGVDPIALGAKDAWPAAHWYYFFALRECSQETMNEAAANRSFDDPCWLKAGAEESSWSLSSSRLSATKWIKRFEPEGLSTARSSSSRQ